MLLLLLLHPPDSKPVLKGGDDFGGISTKCYYTVVFNDWRKGLAFFRLWVVVELLLFSYGLLEGVTIRTATIGR